ncbi:MAG: hypothetical protein SOV54_08525 [Faecalibacterium prausnitzii]|nr:hypothetical protein [Faecalibacterium prausnitzii]MDD7152398.1 hypothetical protein [Faecalibacterium prausnitzii]MDY2682764.1 hypothetical protein [Faecalibacterium prausnitzii]
MSLKAQLDRWFRQKETGGSGEKQQTVALPEVHTGKVRHPEEQTTPAADKSIHYDNVAIPEVHIHPKKQK